MSIPTTRSSAAIVPPKATPAASKRSRRQGDDTPTSSSAHSNQRLGKVVDRIRRQRQQQRDERQHEEYTAPVSQQRSRAAATSSSSKAAVVRPRRSDNKPALEWSGTESEGETLPPLALDARVTRSQTSKAAVVPARPSRSKLEADDAKHKEEAEFAKLLPTPHTVKQDGAATTRKQPARASKTEALATLASPAISVRSSPGRSPASSSGDELGHPGAAAVKRQRMEQAEQKHDPTAAADATPSASPSAKLPSFISPFAQLAAPTADFALADFEKPKPVHRPRKLNPVNPHVSNAKYSGFGKRHKQRFSKGAQKHTDKVRAGWLRTHGMIKKCMPRLIHIVQTLMTDDKDVQNAIEYELRHNSTLHKQVIGLPPRAANTPTPDPVHRWRILYQACATLLRGWRLYPEITVVVTAGCLRHLADSVPHNDNSPQADLVRFYRKVIQLVDKAAISWKTKPCFIVDLVYVLAAHLYHTAHNVSEAYNTLSSHYIRGGAYSRDLRLTVLYAEIELSMMHQTAPTHELETAVQLEQSPAGRSPSSTEASDNRYAEQPAQSPDMSYNSYSNGHSGYKDESIDDEMDDYSKYLDESVYADTQLDQSPVSSRSASPLEDDLNGSEHPRYSSANHGIASTSLTSTCQHRSVAIELLSGALRYAYHRPQPPSARDELLVQATNMLIDAYCRADYVQPLIDAELIQSIDAEARKLTRTITEFRLAHPGDAVAWHMELLLLQYLLSHADELELPVDTIEQCQSQQIYVAYQLHLHDFHSALAYTTLTNEWNTNKYAVQMIPQWLVADVVLRYLCMLLHAQTTDNGQPQQLTQTYAVLADVLDHLLVDVSGPYAIDEIRDQPLSRDERMQLVPIDIEASPPAMPSKQQQAAVSTNISFNPTRWLAALHQYRTILTQTANPSPLHRMAINDLNAYITNVEQLTAKLQPNSEGMPNATPTTSPLSDAAAPSNVSTPML